MKAQFAKLLRLFMSTALFCTSVNAFSNVITTTNSVGVSPNGAAVSSIPIVVPPGIAGMEPKLSLEYNSQRGQGMAGIGWDLAGISTIGRCAQTPGMDGAFGVVNYGGTDRYCIDGQRLAVVSGSYGSGGAEYRTYGESFSKVNSFGAAGNGPEYFIVKTKAGLTMEYGRTSDSQILALGSSTVRVWALNRVSDTSGNYMTVSYWKDSSNGDFYPQTINYTGNTSASQSPTNQVLMTYEARPDIATAYQAGSMVKRAYRLKEIGTYFNGVLVNRYPLTYIVPSATLLNRSLLVKVQRCTNSGCLAPSEFFYSPKDTSLSFTPKQINKGIAPPAVSTTTLTADFDGDGKTDIALLVNDGGSVSIDVYRSTAGYASAQRWITQTGTWTENSPYGQKFIASDVNGDGKVDIVHVTVTEHSYKAHVYVNTGSGFVRQQWLDSGYIDNIGAGGGDINYYPLSLIHLADISGDARPELIITNWKPQQEFGGQSFLIFNNTGTAFLTGPVIAGETGYAQPSNLYFADLDGDGREDMIEYAPPDSRVNVFLSNGTTLVRAIAPSGYANILWPPANPVLMDINNDGRADFVSIYRDSGSLSILVQLNTGNGWAAPVKWANQVGPFAATAQTLTGDLNGDGFPDVILLSGNSTSTTATIYLNDGAGQFLDSGTSTLSTPYSPSPNDQWLSADINGDGKTDYWHIYPDSGAISADLLTSNVSDFLLTLVRNGLGVSTYFTHGSMTDSTVYSKGSGATYPLIDLQIPLKAVKKLETSDGIGGLQTTTYRYGQLRVEVGTGRGLLGFGTTESTQVDTGLTTKTTYRQDWPYTGMPATVVKTAASALGPGGVVSSASTTYTCKTPSTGAGSCAFNGTPYFIYASQVTEQRVDLDGTAMPTVSNSSTYDNFGNPTQLQTTSSDGYSKTTVNTYDNDTSNWLLGRLRRAAVTSVKP